jgi:hypothetical protein
MSAKRNLRGTAVTGTALKGVENVAGQETKNRHYQDSFQLFIVGGGAAEVITSGLLGVVLYGKLLAHIIRCNVLGSKVTEFAMVHPLRSACPIAELYVIVTRDSPQIIVVSDPLTGVHGCFCTGPGISVSQSPE